MGGASGGLGGMTPMNAVSSWLVAVGGVGTVHGVWHRVSCIELPRVGTTYRCITAAGRVDAFRLRLPFGRDRGYPELAVRRLVSRQLESSRLGRVLRVDAASEALQAPPFS